MVLVTEKDPDRLHSPQFKNTTISLAMDAAILTAKNPENAIYLDLESEQDRVKLSQAELYLTQHEDKLVILDEVQRAPELFQNLRGLIDQGRRKGLRSARFFLVRGTYSLSGLGVRWMGFFLLNLL